MNCASGVLMRGEKWLTIARVAFCLPFPRGSMGRISAKTVNLQAKKRAARQHESGLVEDAELARLGWEPVDDAVHSIFAATQTQQHEERHASGGDAGGDAGLLPSGKNRKQSSEAQPGDAPAFRGWRPVLADSATLLTGATEGGFLSLEVCVCVC